MIAARMVEPVQSLPQIRQVNADTSAQQLRWRRISKRHTGHIGNDPGYVLLAGQRDNQVRLVFNCPQ